MLLQQQTTAASAALSIIYLSTRVLQNGLGFPSSIVENTSLNNDGIFLSP
jgi:hypothetical protein